MNERLQLRKFNDAHLLTRTVELGLLDLVKVMLGREVVVLGHADRVVFRVQPAYDAFNPSATER